MGGWYSRLTGVEAELHEKFQDEEIKLVMVRGVNLAHKA
jgi:hypothetical protein